MINTNIEGKLKVAYSLTAIRGVGRRMAHMVVRRAGVDMNKRAGELSPEEVGKLVAVLENPAAFDLPEWSFNRQKDRDTGKSMHLVSSAVDTSLRNDLERLKRNRVHRGMLVVVVIVVVVCLFVAFLCFQGGEFVT